MAQNITVKTGDRTEIMVTDWRFLIRETRKIEPRTMAKFKVKALEIARPVDNAVKRGISKRAVITGMKPKKMPGRVSWGGNGVDVRQTDIKVNTRIYKKGVGVSKGLIAGLLAEEEALVSTAETLANAFITAFNNLMATISIPTPNFEALPSQASANVVAGVDPEKILADRLTNLRSRLDTLGTVEGAAEMATAKSLMSQIRSTAGEWTAMNPNAATGVSQVTNVNVVVKAAAGVDTKKAGQDILKVVNKYATSSGNASLVRAI